MLRQLKVKKIKLKSKLNIIMQLAILLNPKGMLK